MNSSVKATHKPLVTNSKTQARKIAEQLVGQPVRILVGDPRNGEHAVGIHTSDINGKLTLVKGGPTIDLALNFLLASKERIP